VNVFAALLAASIALTAGDASAQRVWIDTDPSCHLPGWHDVDDCLALRWILRAPALRVKGISTVMGNAETALSPAELRRLLRNIGAPADEARIELVRGASSARGAPANDAAQALIAALEEGELTILALGPLTNIAQALALRPNLVPRVRALVFVGGNEPGKAMRLPQQQWTHFHDRNVTTDARAVSTLLALRAPLVLIPFEAMTGFLLRAEDFAAVMSDAPALAEAMQRWQSLWRQRLGLDGFVPFDLVAATWLTGPEHFKCMPVNVTLHDAKRTITGLRHALTIGDGEPGHLASRCRVADAGAIRAQMVR
jgi:purine nucleosidase